MENRDDKYLLLYLLKQFNSICEKTGIVYYASAGTCLGAVRHNGFIPWDDDIDCMMPREYYPIFVEACNKSLPSEVVIHTRENDPLFCCEYAKLCFRDDILGFSDISLDVFFLDDTNPNRVLMRMAQNGIHKVLYYLKVFKVSRIRGNKYVPRNIIKYFLLKLMSFISLKKIDSLLDKVMTAEKSECTHFVNWGSCHPYKNATYSKAVLGNPVKMPFENQYVMVAEHTEVILTQLFSKDYMTPPPLDKRISHGNRPLSNNRIDIDYIRVCVSGNSSV